MSLKYFAILFLAALAAGQDVPTTITDGLRDSQADLALGHEFFETTLFINRGQISAYMYRINRELIDSHVDAYGNMKERILATNDALDEFEPSECLNAVRQRWEFQINR